MRLVKILIAAGLFVCALLATAPHASAQNASDLSGVWQGVYWGGGNQPTAFQVTLRDDAGPAISGSIVENNGFGDMNSPFLLATFSGRTQGVNVSFIKSYDGTGGVAHSVSYEGRLLSNGRRIVGAWTTEGLSGQFEMAR